MATINSLLKKSDNGRFLYHAFLGKSFKVENPLKCRCKNPFYDDFNADLTFYEGENGRLRFHDHGDSSFSGDVFDFAKHYFDLHEDEEFPQLLAKCDELLKQYFEGTGSANKGFKPSKTAKKVGERKSKRTFSLDKIEFSEEAIAYWEQSGVTEDILNEYNVCQISGFDERDEYGQMKMVDLKDELAFAYQFQGFAKLYFPNRENYRYQFVGTKDKDYWFGSKLLDFDANGAKLIIGAGERDVLALIANGFEAITLSSENAKLPKRLMKDIYEAGYEVFCLYDNDKTGRREAKRLRVRHQIPTIDIFASLNRGQKRNVNDTTDFVIQGYDLKETITTFLDADCNSSDVEDTKSVDQISQIFPLLQPTHNKLRNESLFDNRIYKQLPPLISKVVEGYGDSHMRDVILFSTIVAMGSITTKVRGEYFNKMVPTNLYGYVLGGSSSGKNKITVARKLIEPIHDRLFNQSVADLKEFNKLTIAKKAKTERPKFRQFLVPANTSAAALAKYLDANNGMAFMFEEEADTLSMVMGQDWGDISIALRKGAEGEPYSLGRISLDVPINLKHIYISFVFTSTPSQLKRMIPSQENGLLSRILFYELPMKVEWLPPFNSQSAHDSIIKDVSAALLRFWEREEQKSFETTFYFTDDQIQVFNDEFSTAQTEERELHGDNTMMIIRRLAACTFRIAMILSMMRKMEKKPLGRFIRCEDCDFETAMLLARYFRRKGIDVLNSYPKVNTSIIGNNEQIERFYAELPDEFTAKEFKEVAQSISLALGTAKENITKMVKKGQLVRVSHGNYKKVKND